MPKLLQLCTVVFANIVVSLNDRMTIGQQTHFDGEPGRFCDSRCNGQLVHSRFLDNGLLADVFVEAGHCPPPLGDRHGDIASRPSTKHVAAQANGSPCEVVVPQ